jgi:prolyl oligopeptidase
MTRALAQILTLTLALMTLASAAPAAPLPDDPYVWLEPMTDAKALQWVEAENARTLSVLEKDLRYPGLYAEALKIAEASDRIPSPSFLGGLIYNFWQDAEHVQGLWRRTTAESYATANPAWEPVLDLDALSKADGVTWVWKGAVCKQPEETRCLVQLSNGGADAVTVREFDLTAKAFVEGGITLSTSKQDVAWLDADTALVARDWGPGTMTASGYPFVVKAVRRGQPLDQARELFRGVPADVGVTPATFTDGDGFSLPLAIRSVSFFEAEVSWIRPDGAKRIVLPLKGDLEGLVQGRLVVKLNQDWRFDGQDFKAGALVAATPEVLAAGKGPIELIFNPGPRQSVEEVTVTRSKVLASILDNVRGRGWAFSRGPAGWTSTPLALPDNAAVGLGSANGRDERVFLSVTGFLTPTTLLLADLATGSLASIKALPAKFDASRHVVEQHEATSKDGTKVPYFLVIPKDAKRDGSNPTLLYAYGGFQNSVLPGYSATVGKLWLERGGTYAIANIRGGGEFGPAWHEAGLKTNRQRIYDDFAAVAEDLIKRGVTSPRRLGARGGSNGGLLMGVEYNQRPDLWRAMIIDVPLLDMLRFEQIAAGASWVGEYGSVGVPAERAFLEKISPLQNLKAGTKGPEPFIFTTTKDDRVGPGHARKFAARMKALGLPYLYYENTEGGHGSGANQREAARVSALEMTYLTRKLMD